MRPFLDQPIQLGPSMEISVFFRFRTTFAGSSGLNFLATLQTRRSPSRIWTESMSDFCRDDEACHAKLTMGDGPLEVVRLCRIVKRGCRVAIKREPF